MLASKCQNPKSKVQWRWDLKKIGQIDEIQRPVCNTPGGVSSENSKLSNPPSSFPDHQSPFCRWRGSMIPMMNRPSFKNAPVPWPNQNPAPPQKKSVWTEIFLFGTTKKKKREGRVDGLSRFGFGGAKKIGEFLAAEKHIDLLQVAPKMAMASSLGSWVTKLRKCLGFWRNKNEACNHEFPQKK